MENKGQWYVVQTLSGKENKAKDSIDKRMEQEGLAEYIHEILVPTETVSEVKRGKKRTANRKFFPGYVLANLDLLDENHAVREDVWYFIKNTNGIINFLGGESPVPLSQREVDDIMLQLQEDEDTVKPKIEFEAGETVKVKDGPFENFEGVITSVDPDRGKLHISVTIFGRSTPVEVEYWQVERS